MYLGENLVTQQSRCTAVEVKGMNTLNNCNIHTSHSLLHLFFSSLLIVISLPVWIYVSPTSPCYLSPFLPQFRQ